MVSALRTLAVGALVLLLVPSLLAEPGTAFESHVYGGEDALPGEHDDVAFVWHVQGGVGGAGIESARACSATLIAEAWVLTAAHCVSDHPDRDTYVGFGLDGEDEILDLANFAPAEAVELHPEHGGSSSGADLALVALPEAVDADPRPLAADRPSPGAPATIAGWGRTGPDSYPERLQVAGVPVVDDEDCAAVFADRYDPTTMLCAGEGQPASPDTCEGDSGGPLLDDGWGALAGVTSFGQPGCAGSTIGVYTAVAMYLDWILETTDGAPVVVADDGEVLDDELERPGGGDPADEEAPDDEEPGDGQPDDPVAPTRLFGPDRVGTAVATAGRWDSADTVLLATARAFPDALVAGALSALEDAPLLLTEPSELPSAVADEIARLAPRSVQVLGGEAAISDDVVEQLGATGVEVERIAGATRQETAARVALRTGAPRGEVVIASATDFPDAMSAAALLATAQRPPVLLTGETEVPPATLETLDVLEATDVTVVGGERAVGPEVVERLEAVGYAVERLAGANRYQTSLEVAREALEREPQGREVLITATGEDFPDALTAGSLVARERGVLLLAPPGELAPGTSELLQATAWTDFFVVGGDAVTDPRVAADIAALLPPVP